MSCEMEKILGVSVALDETIPGAVPVDGVEFVYFCDDGHSSASEQFYALTNYTNPPHAQCGGASLNGCRLTLPDRSIFHSIGYHGDIAGWQQDIKEGAVGLNVVLARVDADTIIISDGRIFELSSCIPKYDW